MLVYGSSDFNMISISKIETSQCVEDSKTKFHRRDNESNDVNNLLLGEQKNSNVILIYINKLTQMTRTKSHNASW